MKRFDEFKKLLMSHDRASADAVKQFLKSSYRETFLSKMSDGGQWDLERGDRYLYQSFLPSFLFFVGDDKRVCFEKIMDVHCQEVSADHLVRSFGPFLNLAMDFHPDLIDAVLERVMAVPDVFSPQSDLWMVHRRPASKDFLARILGSGSMDWSKSQKIDPFLSHITGDHGGRAVAFLFDNMVKHGVINFDLVSKMFDHGDVFSMNNTYFRRDIWDALFFELGERRSEAGSVALMEKLILARQASMDDVMATISFSSQNMIMGGNEHHEFAPRLMDCLKQMDKTTEGIIKRSVEAKSYFEGRPEQLRLYVNCLDLLLSCDPNAVGHWSAKMDRFVQGICWELQKDWGVGQGLDQRAEKLILQRETKGFEKGAPDARKHKI